MTQKNVILKHIMAQVLPNKPCLHMRVTCPLLTHVDPPTLKIHVIKALFFVPHLIPLVLGSQLIAHSILRHLGTGFEPRIRYL